MSLQVTGSILSPISSLVPTNVDITESANKMTEAASILVPITNATDQTSIAETSPSLNKDEIQHKVTLDAAKHSSTPMGIDVTAQCSMSKCSTESSLTTRTIPSKPVLSSETLPPPSLEEIRTPLRLTTPISPPLVSYLSSSGATPAILLPTSSSSLTPTISSGSASAVPTIPESSSSVTPTLPTPSSSTTSAEPASSSEASSPPPPPPAPTLTVNVGTTLAMIQAHANTISDGIYKKSTQEILSEIKGHLETMFPNYPVKTASSFERDAKNQNKLKTFDHHGRKCFTIDVIYTLSTVSGNKINVKQTIYTNAVDPKKALQIAKNYNDNLVDKETPSNCIIS